MAHQHCRFVRSGGLPPTKNDFLSMSGFLESLSPSWRVASIIAAHERCIKVRDLGAVET
jgi:hypothetical protein